MLPGNGFRSEFRYVLALAGVWWRRCVLILPLLWEDGADGL